MSKVQMSFYFYILYSASFHLISAAGKTGDMPKKMIMYAVTAQRSVMYLNRDRFS